MAQSWIFFLFFGGVENKDDTIMVMSGLFLLIVSQCFFLCPGFVAGDQRFRGRRNTKITNLKKGKYSVFIKQLKIGRIWELSSPACAFSRLAVTELVSSAAPPSTFPRKAAEKKGLMEMHEIAGKKKQREAEMAAKEPMLEVKGQENPYTRANVPTPAAEKAEPGDYTELKKSSEDIYSNIAEPTKRPVKQIQEAMRPYRVACLIVTVLSLVLLMVVVVLLVKMKTGSGACPMSAMGWKPATCTVEQCRTFSSQHRDRCYCCHQCPPRWVRLDQTCFLLSTLRLSWEESKYNCTGEGGSLAVVSSQKVQSFLTQNGNGRKYWIGLRSTGDAWTWIDDNALQQSYWGANQTTGDCGILSSNKLADNNWITSPCSSYTYYICQMHL